MTIKMRLPLNIESEIVEVERELDHFIKQRAGLTRLRALRAAIEEFMHMVGYSGK